MPKTKLELTGRQKVAILLIFLGPEISAHIFKEFSEEEIELLTLEIAKMQKVDPDVRDSVLDEFKQLLDASEFISMGGIGYARELLEKTLGSEKASEILGKLTATFQVRPFDVVRTLDPSQLLNFIQGEHPQAIALILSFLSAEKSAYILSQLSQEVQADVARRVAKMESTSPEVVREMERILEKKLSSVLSEDYTSVGGIDAIVEVLSKVDRGTEKSIIETLEIQDPELAEEIKKRMFVFEDVIHIDDRGIQRILREVDTKDLSVALKGSTEEVMEKFTKNMSKRAAAMLEEDMEFMGPVRVKDVEESQQKVVNIIRSLEEQGEIVISRGGEEEIIA
ncbi:MAG: flagellar motor switch protein FliG [Candidatus Muiribacterium halophilum]|uniref:Flagellar motor switch protein FliG n=1 Tax=Muiribacterium halophilum TaxID=2053465 RepID=A0A2N5ZDK5_MUIH1|nr:MAG: flagellar motor switch protein FliG [Candidatus Muirbacterium halophilum]